jgi:hypothetical protein
LYPLGSNKIDYVLRYSQFIDALLFNGSLMQRLRPTESSDPDAVIRVREAPDSKLTDGRTVSNETLFPLVRGALLYAVDAIDESYRSIKPIGDDTALYWRGMIHRREGDFYSARNCFRSVGSHPVYGELHRAASAVSPDMAKQWGWDPYLFVGLCEQEKFGDRRHSTELIKLQRVEFDALFDYVWRKSFAL